MKGIKKWFKNLKYKWDCKREEKRFNKYKKIADDKHRLTGKRHFVIPVSKTELMVVNNDWLKIYNSKAGKGYKRTFKQLIELSYYATPAGKTN